MPKKNILICGATGFIGRNLTEKISKNPNCQVFATYNTRPPFQCKGVEFVQADLTKISDVNRLVGGIDILIQAAATTSGAKDIITKPHYHVTDNAVMNSLLFRSAFEKSTPHVIFFSCTVMYQSGDKKVSETDFDANQEIFPSYFGVGWTKVYIEKMAQFYSRFNKTKFTIIRHSNIYGPHDKYDLERSHVFGATVAKVLTAKSGKVTVWGTGEEARDLLYVDDLVEFVETAIIKQQSPYELVNVGLGSAIAVKDLVAKIIQHSGKNLEIQYDTTKPTIKTKLALDISKAEKVYGWKPQTTLDDGIKKSLQWYNENIKEI